MAYNVQLEKFEGPLDLLLKLIEEQKLDITLVSISKVADDYLEYIRASQDISLENLAEFITVASKIILIKSQSILPNLEIAPEEEKEIKDLEQQLREYKKFKEASEKIKEIFAKGHRSFSRDYLLNVSADVFLPPKNLNAFDLKKILLNIIAEIILPDKVDEEAVQEIITLEEKINDFHQKLQSKVEFYFSHVSSTAKNRIDVIVAFLALLEMIKQRLVTVEQNSLFSDIKIAKIDNSN
ncbi:MAG: segregation/condensation protein A [Parcubacteria group bacterium]|jgi:segregation and condensation protein A